MRRFEMKYVKAIAFLIMFFPLRLLLGEGAGGSPGQDLATIEQKLANVQESINENASSQDELGRSPNDQAGRALWAGGDVEREKLEKEEMGLLEKKLRLLQREPYPPRLAIEEIRVEIAELRLKLAKRRGPCLVRGSLKRPMDKKEAILEIEDDSPCFLEIFWKEDNGEKYRRVEFENSRILIPSDPATQYGEGFFATSAADSGGMPGIGTLKVVYWKLTESDQGPTFEKVKEQEYQVDLAKESRIHCESP
jgi:hypothetical protein